MCLLTPPTYSAPGDRQGRYRNTWELGSHISDQAPVRTWSPDTLYFQGRAPLTLTTAYSMHCRPFSIACCLPSDAPAAALAGRWQRGSRQGWEWVWASGKGWSGWARPRWDATLKVLTENIRPPPWPVKALTWPFMRLQAHMTFPAMRPIRQVPVPLPTIPLASCPGSSHGLRM